MIFSCIGLFLYTCSPFLYRKHRFSCFSCFKGSSSAHLHLVKTEKGVSCFFYSSPLLYLPRIFLHSSSSFLFFIFFLRYRFGRFFSWRKGETLLKKGKGGFYSLNIEQIRGLDLTKCYILNVGASLLTSKM